MKTIAIFFSILLCGQTYSQRKSFQGFYINSKGDTVKGSLPGYIQWNKNPNKVEFMAFRSSSTTVLTPLNCLKFQIENYDEYIAYSGQRLINPIEDQAVIEAKVYTDYSDQFSNITCFLRTVIKTPRCEIYVLNDNIRTNFFYKLPGDTIKELRFKKYFDENKVNDIYEYRQQFSNLFTEDISRKNLEKSLEELAYREDAIELFIEKLFSSKRLKVKNPAAGWVVAGGISANSFKIDGFLLYSGATSNYKTTFSPFISAGYFIPFQRNFSRYFFYPQVRAHNYKNEVEYPTGSFIQQVSFQSDLIISPELNGGANIINKDDFRLFLYGGLGLTFLINNKETIKNLMPADRSVYYSDEIPMSKMGYAFNLSSGINIKNKILILISYHFPTQVANFVEYTPIHSNLQLGIGYKFRQIEKK